MTTGLLSSASANLAMVYVAREMQWCPICETNGAKRRLRLSQINLNEAVWICDNVQCPYPLGVGSASSGVVHRKASEIGNRKKRKRSLCDSAESKKCKRLGSSSVSDTASIVTGLELDELLDFLNSPEIPGGQDNCAKEIETRSSLQIDTNEVAFQRTADFVKNLPMQPYIHTEEGSGVSATVDLNSLKNKKSFHRKVFGGYTANSHHGKQGENDSKVLETDNPVENAESWSLQWQNKEALCWLDAALCLLVHSKNLCARVQSLKDNSESVIRDLCHIYDEVQTMVFGDGNATTRSGLDSSDLSVAVQRLEDVRGQIFSHLQPTLNCKLGQNDSPVQALPILLKQHKGIEQHFLSNYQWKFSCSKCGYEKMDKLEKLIVTFPNVDVDFNMTCPYFVRPCYQCNADNQKSTLMFDRVADCLLLHFAEGVPSNNVDRYKFIQDGVAYRVTAVVQYIQNPKHFVTWCRDHHDNWLKCDDLESCVTQWSKDAPTFPGSETHIVLWERQNAEVKGQEGKAVSARTPADGAALPSESTASELIIVPQSAALKKPMSTSSVCDLSSSCKGLTATSAVHTTALQCSGNVVAGATVIDTLPSSKTAVTQLHKDPISDTNNSNATVQIPDAVRTNTTQEKTAELNSSALTETFTTKFSRDSVIISPIKDKKTRQDRKFTATRESLSSGDIRMDSGSPLITSTAGKVNNYLTLVTQGRGNRRTAMATGKAASILSKIPSKMLNTRPQRRTTQLESRLKSSAASVKNLPSSVNVVSGVKHGIVNSVARSTPTVIGANKFASYNSRTVGKKQFSGYVSDRQKSVSLVSFESSPGKTGYNYTGIEPFNNAVVLDYDVQTTVPENCWAKRPSSVSFSDQNSPSSLSSVSSQSSRDDLFSCVHDELYKALDICSDTSCVTSRAASPITDDFFTNLISDDAVQSDKMMAEVISELNDII